MAGITLISIHALLAEGDGKSWFVLPAVDISIHALREEGDVSRWGQIPAAADFYPRPPRGGRPQNCTKKSDSKCARRINFFERCRCF